MDTVISNNFKRAEKHVNVDKLLGQFKHIGELKEKYIPIIDEITPLQITAIVNESKKEVRKLPKYQQSKYAVNFNSCKKLLGAVKASTIFAEVEKQHKNFPIAKEVIWNFVQEMQSFVNAVWYDPKEALKRGSFI